MPESGSK